MKEFDIDSFLEKAEELKALFVLGHRVIPFLEEIFLFFKEIKPQLDEINNSIEENLKKMPNVSKQLSKVTEATESATTEIMDTVDGIQFKLDMIVDNLNKLKENKADNSTSPIKLYELIQKAVDSEDNLQDKLPEIIDEYKKIKKNSSPQNQDLIKDSNEIVNTIKEDSNSIMMALQVQDITSQQLAAVNYLLITIQDKLGSIMKKFSHDEMREVAQQAQAYNEGTDTTKLHKEVAFDPDAINSITDKESRQNDIDDLIEKSRKELEESGEEKVDKHQNDQESPNDVTNDEVSQDDIDKLFNNQ